MCWLRKALASRVRQKVFLSSAPQASVCGSGRGSGTGNGA